MESGNRAREYADSIYAVEMAKIANEYPESLINNAMCSINTMKNVGLSLVLKTMNENTPFKQTKGPGKGKGKRGRPRKS